MEITKFIMTFVAISLFTSGGTLFAGQDHIEYHQEYQDRQNREDDDRAYHHRSQQRRHYQEMEKNYLPTIDNSHRYRHKYQRSYWHLGNNNYDPIY